MVGITTAIMNAETGQGWIKEVILPDLLVVIFIVAAAAVFVLAVVI